MTSASIVSCGRTKEPYITTATEHGVRSGILTADFEPICFPLPVDIVAPTYTCIIIATSTRPVLAILIRDIRRPRPDGLAPSDLAFDNLFRCVLSCLGMVSFEWPRTLSLDGDVPIYVNEGTVPIISLRVKR